MAPSGHDYAKELTRKLYWAVTSTLPSLTKDQRAHSFTWAASMADRIIDRHPSLPPSVDDRLRKDYHRQAVGRGGGRNNDPPIRGSVRPLPPPNMPAWERQQAALRERAWAHVQKGRSGGSQLPIPADVYREVGNGRSNSTG